MSHGDPKELSIERIQLPRAWGMSIEEKEGQDEKAQGKEEWQVMRCGRSLMT